MDAAKVSNSEDTLKAYKTVLNTNKAPAEVAENG